MLEYKVRASRVDAHGRLVRTKEAEITLDTDESEQRLALLHANVRKYGTISNSVAEETRLGGTIRRKT